MTLRLPARWIFPHAGEGAIDAFQRQPPVCILHPRGRGDRSTCLTQRKPKLWIVEHPAARRLVIRKGRTPGLGRSGSSFGPRLYGASAGCLCLGHGPTNRLVRRRAGPRFGRYRRCRDSRERARWERGNPDFSDRRYRRYGRYRGHVRGCWRTGGHDGATRDKDE